MLSTLAVRMMYAWHGLNGADDEDVRSARPQMNLDRDGHLIVSVASRIMSYSWMLTQIGM